VTAGHPHAPAFLARSAAVIGLGLIGGSLARELAARGVRVTGADADEATVAAALAEGVIAAALSPDLRELRDAEVIVLAVPVDASVELLARLAPHAHRARLITDAGSTKAAIVAAAERLGLGARFVGGHPLAGDHRSGWAASRLGLFARARAYLCPAAGAGAAAVALAAGLWRSLGADPAVVPADAHDRQLAWVSHLPQLASAALALALRDAGHPRASLGRGGRDVTRLAGSSTSMWTPVALENAAELARALAALETRLAHLRTALEIGDRRALDAVFDASRAWSEAAASV
jgi:prephenate dehydrogenase